MKQQFSKQIQPGYSYIELMVAVLIIFILIGFVGPKMFKLLSDTEKASTKQTLKVVRDAIMTYKANVGSYPNILKDLVKKPAEGAVGWDGPYVGDENSANPTVPQDAWHQDLVYKLKPRGTKPPFELYSLGNPEKDDARIDA